MFRWWSAVLIIVVCLIDRTSCRGGRGRGSSKTKSKLAKCNLRLDYWEDSTPATIEAIARLRSEEVNGWILFQQQYLGGPTKITGQLEFPNPAQTYGMLIVERGRKRCNVIPEDTDSTAWAGTHYNPFNSEHGDSKSCRRHVGDLDPVKSADNRDTATAFTQWDIRVQLQGPTSVIGRSVVILQRTKDDKEMTGTRLACGVIGFKSGTNFTVTHYRQRTVEDETLPMWFITSVVLIAGCGYSWLLYSHCYLREINRYRHPDAAVAQAHEDRLAKRRQKTTTSFQRWLN